MNKWYKYNYSKQNKCSICGILISNKAHCCSECVNKSLLYKNNMKKRSGKYTGKGNPNYRHGNTIIFHYCKNCKQKISYPTWAYNSQLCMTCSRKGKRSFRYGKPPTHGKKTYYKNTWMRSSWEVKFAQFLDLSNIKWKYESKTFDLGDMTYTPDFYLKEFDYHIEIKGYWRDNAKKKFNLFKKQYPKINILLLMKKELIDLGVL